jgi:hypothetical protein
VQWSKELTDNRPMQLFADQSQVDQLDQGVLQHGRNLFANVAAEGRQMRSASGLKFPDCE